MKTLAKKFDSGRAQFNWLEHFRMAGKAYRVQYSNETAQHLRLLTARQRQTVFNAVDEQLTYEAAIPTRNRKRMRPNPLAPWELRIGGLRVYYDVEEEPEPVVFVLAVGLKERNLVRIGREVMHL